jgi:DNA-binding response OmpR family regulator
MPEPDAKKPKVLIVDDDRDTREMLALALEVEGFDVSQIPNGIKLVSALEVDRPDVILLDVMMSWIDGFELCRSIRRNGEFGKIPIIFVSAKKGAEDVRRGLEAGAADYFTKPVDMPRLTERLRELSATSADR